MSGGGKAGSGRRVASVFSSTMLRTNSLTARTAAPPPARSSEPVKRAYRPPPLPSTTATIRMPAFGTSSSLGTPKRRAAFSPSSLSTAKLTDFFLPSLKLMATEVYQSGSSASLPSSSSSTLGVLSAEPCPPCRKLCRPRYFTVGASLLGPAGALGSLGSFSSLASAASFDSCDSSPGSSSPCALTASSSARPSTSLTSFILCRGR
mmetsp:Transcript_31883/g.75319  ORF Transcript_31883/g.75319 Transcript_31883/m.75319 type:complete len:206 (-) Transcript_31883:7-624(-)